VVREAIGVVGAITPWNYPLNQIVAKVAPASRPGAPVVLKPSEVTPLNAFQLTEVIESVGAPRRGLQHGHRDRPGRRRGDRRPPGVDMVSFTGSTRAGRRSASSPRRP
jgi:acyl-CoA reductase-like NAD-dependent aldehyde dehydrogenase